MSEILAEINYLKIYFIFLKRRKKKMRGPKGPRAPNILGGRRAPPSPTIGEREGIIPSHLLFSSFCLNKNK
jgi:hypothetical protein